MVLLVLMAYNKMADKSGISQLLHELQTVEEVDSQWDYVVCFEICFQSNCLLESIPVKGLNNYELTAIVNFHLWADKYSIEKLRISK